MTTAPAFQSDARRTPGARPRMPQLRDALIAQLRATGLALRIPLLIGAALAVVVTLVLALLITSRGVSVKLHTEPSSLPGILGALLPVAVWAREERFGPGFLWTLPVDRSRHALIKVLAGWVWLMAGVALFALCQLVIALVSGARALPVETLHLLTTPLAPLTPVNPAALRTVQWAPGPIIWLIPFASATATYLLASAVVLGIRYPLRWVVAVVALFAGLNIASSVASWYLAVGWLEEAPGRVLSLLVESRYGLETLLTLQTWSLDRRATLTTGETIMVWSAVPDLAAWSITALLWTGAGLLALWAAAWRHREERHA